MNCAKTTDLLAFHSHSCSTRLFTRVHIIIWIDRQRLCVRERWRKIAAAKKCIVATRWSTYTSKSQWRHTSVCARFSTSREELTYCLAHSSGYPYDGACSARPMAAFSRESSLVSALCWLDYVFRSKRIVLSQFRSKCISQSAQSAY